jgi:hypothetical protein
MEPPPLIALHFLEYTDLLNALRRGGDLEMNWELRSPIPSETYTFLVIYERRNHVSKITCHPSLLYIKQQQTFFVQLQHLFLELIVIIEG